MRPLIFSTALPPISMAWSDFIFNKVLNMQQQRQHLAEISHFLQQAVIAKGFSSPSSSHIIPIIVGESNAAIEKVRYVQQQGFYAMPVRPPTVSQNSSRLRISLTSMVQKAELEKLVECL
jgi:8-amino-7-oxononanoate synthase